MSKEVETNPDNQQHNIEEDLRFKLVSHQYELLRTRTEKSDTHKPVGLLVLINGMEQAGKGKAVTQLREWVDPRLLQVEATIGQKQSKNEPIWLRHTAKLPRHGETCIYFGNWYADLIHTVFKMKTAKNKEKDWKEYLITHLETLQEYESDLAQNNTRVLKCWFDIDNKTLKKRLTDNQLDPKQLYQIDWLNKKQVAEFNSIAKEIISKQDDWVIISGQDNDQATSQLMQLVLSAWQEAISFSQQAVDNKPQHKFIWSDIPSELNDITDKEFKKSEYKQKLEKKQRKLAKLLRDCGERSVVFAFEGMDAAGKGGAIKRLVAKLDPREYKIHSIAAPMQNELAHPYLWRFWIRLPTEADKRIVIFDRTWYGRVLVERIEGFASEAEWQRAYDEINRFESDLAKSGTIVLKYWMAIDKNEQLKRFEERRDTPHKQHKLTDEDWRNRDKWQDYVQAAADMLARTNSKNASWCMVASNDKKTARLMVLDHAIEQIKKALG